jgi:hypothetical protein
LLIPIILGISVTSCSSVKKIEVLTSPVEKVPLLLPPVEQIKLDAIEWVIVTEANVDQVFAQLEKKKYDAVVFGVNDKGYESLSVNLAKIRQLVEQQKAVIVAYDKYYNQQSINIEQAQNNHDEKKQQMEEKSKSEKPWWEVW